MSRELLEMAAKAAGVDYDPEKSFPKKPSGVFFGLWLNIKCEPYDGQPRRWNPLKDDGDALRLAVADGCKQVDLVARAAAKGDI